MKSWENNFEINLCTYLNNKGNVKVIYQYRIKFFFSLLKDETKLDGTLQNMRKNHVLSRNDEEIIYYKKMFKGY